MTDKPIKHFAAGAFIFTKEPPRRTLLVNHRKLGVWLPPGGHLMESENPVEAAIREVREETGLDISEYIEDPVVYDQAAALPLPKYLLEEKIPAHKGESEHFHLDLVYSVEMPHQDVSHDDQESRDIGWFTAGELSALPMFDNTRTILKQEMT